MTLARPLAPCCLTSWARSTVCTTGFFLAAWAVLGLGRGWGEEGTEVAGEEGTRLVWKEGTGVAGEAGPGVASLAAVGVGGTGLGTFRSLGPWVGLDCAATIRERKVGLGLIARKLGTILLPPAGLLSPEVEDRESPAELGVARSVEVTEPRGKSGPVVGALKTDHSTGF